MNVSDRYQLFSTKGTQKITYLLHVCQQIKALTTIGNKAMRGAGLGLSLWRYSVEVASAISVAFLGGAAALVADPALFPCHIKALSMCWKHLIGWECSRRSRRVIYGQHKIREASHLAPCPSGAITANSRSSSRILFARLSDWSLLVPRVAVAL